jgi:hypothetical protein
MFKVISSLSRPLSRSREPKLETLALLVRAQVRGKGTGAPDVDDVCVSGMVVGTLAISGVLWVRTGIIAYIQQLNTTVP